MSLAESLKEQIMALDSLVCQAYDDLEYADGLAFSQARERYRVLQQELGRSKDMYKKLTLHTVEMPWHIHIQRVREKIHEAQKRRVQEIMLQMVNNYQ
ncbi:hypothetical protein D3C85_1141140 [compost metagenome]